MVSPKLLLCSLILTALFSSLFQSYQVFSFPSFAFAATTAYEVAENQESEASALLEWKDSLESQSLAYLSSWSTKTSPCTWEGIFCDESKSVTTINVANFGLKGTLLSFNFSSFPKLLTLDISHNMFNGTIPEQISNLSRISQLKMDGNIFSGSIPVSMMKLASLSLLNLSANNLSGYIPQEIVELENMKHLLLGLNKLSGVIPPAIGMLKTLVELNLSSNSFSGTIPSLRNLTNLERLDLSFNSLSGPIPEELGKLYALIQLQLSYNNLSGKIPPSIGDLVNLTVFEINQNQIYGSIPSSIGNLTKMVNMSMGYNMISGPIPFSLGTLANLNSLQLAMNNISGVIPPTFGNLTKLAYFLVYGNKLHGKLPPEMNNFTYIQSLQLSYNNFTGPLPQQICLGVSLKYFGATENYFTGPVPRSLKNCSSLYRINLSRNQLTGNITDVFGIYPSLNYVDLSSNQFYGSMSPNWAKSPSLLALKMSNNKLSGGIPPELGQAPKLQVLALSSNQLTGKIPKELGNLTLLFDLSISNNMLSDNIPMEIGSLLNLTKLELGANSLSGPIPKQIGGLLNLINLNLSKNKFTENIPSEFSQLQSLQDLDLSWNLLNGQIPVSLVKLQRLEKLNLSHNNLSGKIPSTFKDMFSLTNVSISDNQLEGSIPNNPAFLGAPFDALKNNKGLCGNASGLLPCQELSHNLHGKKKSVIMLALSVTLGALFLVAFFGGILFCIHYQKARKTKMDAKTESKDHFSIWSYDGKLVYENIIEATEGFDDKYLIGKGGSATVYKANLPTGQIVAVKKFHAVIEEESPSGKAFHSEARALTEIKHRNIVKLYGYCLHSHFSFLVYEFLEGGSLDKVLDNDTHAVMFDWNRRVHVVKGVANALYHMHHGCSPPIIHRDISSKNVLIDLEYEARISDFGTAKILNPDSNNLTSFAGTYGYAAPEFAYTMEATVKCDVFSFGVLCLELIMGKHPGDLISSLLSSSNLLLKDVLDQRLPHPVKPVVEEVIMIAKTAFACISESPRIRPTMEQVYNEFVMPKSPPMGPFPMVTVSQLLNN